MALIHDDLIDDSDRRRGVVTAHRHAAPAGRPDAEAVGRSVALLAGDLAAVLADELLATSGFEPAAIARARTVYDRMREDMAAGQASELLGVPPPDLAEAMRRADLRGGGYSVEGPLRIGAALAGAPPEVEAALSAFGAALGRAFQLADDLRDGEAADGVDRALVERLVVEATRALGGVPEEAAGELRSVAETVRAGVVAGGGRA
jgi:geranylgeranyl diphosphate synthase type I